MTTTLNDARRKPRICLCVMMNHPFPAILPLIRRIYAGRFTHLRFLIPFERMEDKDVITVYRGSYSHAAYLADARAELDKLDFEYLFVIHDDVIMNPRLSEDTFLSTFDGIGPDDGFIPEIGGSPSNFGGWIWNSAFAPQLLFPKSLLFGTGIERANISRYLPSAERLEQAMSGQGITHTRSITFNSGQMDDIARTPSRVLLHGLAEPLREDEEAQALENEALDVQTRLVALIGATLRHMRLTHGEDSSTVELPFPVAAAGYFTDFYILPRSGFADFAHHMGVAGAANLFVEIIAPSILSACCSKLWTARELGLDFEGFHGNRYIQRFVDPRVIALHPFKLSAFRDGAAQDEFLQELNRIAAEPAQPGAHSAPVLSALDLGAGWHPREEWGVWARETQADFRVKAPADGGMRIVLRAPLHRGLPRLTGRLEYNGGRSTQEFVAELPALEIAVELADVVPDDGGVTRIVIHSDAFVRPCDISPGSTDDRSIGVGLVAAMGV